MQDEAHDFWFPAKRYGLGWGPPVAWQGWLVLAGYILLTIGGAAVFLAQRQTFAFVAYTALITGGLIAICWLKGEKPRWRWGGK